MLLKGILQRRERCTGPVKSGDVNLNEESDFLSLQIQLIETTAYLVNCLTPGGAQTTKETTMESRFEGKYRKLRTSWRVVKHARLYDAQSDYFIDVLY